MTGRIRRSSNVDVREYITTGSTYTTYRIKCRFVTFEICGRTHKQTDTHYNISLVVEVLSILFRSAVRRTAWWRSEWIRWESKSGWMARWSRMTSWWEPASPSALPRRTKWLPTRPAFPSIRSMHGANSSWYVRCCWVSYNWPSVTDWHDSSQTVGVDPTDL